MKHQSLNYRIHDPNPAHVTAEYVLKVLIDVNAEKARAAIEAACLQQHDNENTSEKGHSA